jgi:hypothetical protein
VESAHLIEIAHILAGPLLGILVTALAFNDDHLIQGKLEAFFQQHQTPNLLKTNTKDMMAGAIAFATFLGNVYLFVFNGFIAFIVFAAQYLRAVAIISLVGGACLIIQAVYLFRKYGVLDLGEEAAPLPWKTEMLYPKFLQWEQFFLSIFILIYFAVGVYLNPTLSGLNMEAPTGILATFGPIILVVMGSLISIKPPSATGTARWMWLAAFLILGVPIAVASYVTLHGTDTILERVHGNTKNLDQKGPPIPDKSD